MKISGQIQAPNKTLVCVNPGSLALTKGKSYRGYELGEYYMYIEDDRGCIISVAYKWGSEPIFVSLDEHRRLRIEVLGI